MNPLKRTRAGALVATSLLITSGLTIPVEAVPSIRMISVNDVTLTEGTGGTSTAVFTVSVSEKGKALTVDYSTANISALGGKDYTPAAGTLTLGRNILVAQVAVPVATDSIDEYDETFALDLSNATDGVIFDPQGIGRILDDDLPPIVSIDDVSVLEGDSGTTQAEFFASLSDSSEKIVSFEAVTNDVTAAAGADYVSTSQTINFASGERLKSFTVEVIGDTRDEQNEQFQVVFSNASNIVFARSDRVVATILDDDPVPSVAISSIALMEGNSETNQAVLDVTLSRPSGQEVSVPFASQDGSAKAGSDYTKISGVLSFSPGETQKQLTIDIISESLYEGDEELSVVLGQPSNADLAEGKGKVSIVNDDPAPVLRVADVTAGEDSGVATFTFTLSAPSNMDAIFSYETRDGSALSAFDYSAVSSMAAIQAGESSTEVSIPVGNDAMDEFDESFDLVITQVFNATAERSAATATIIDDDAQPVLSVGDLNVSEGNGGSPQAVFEFTLSETSGKPISVSYSTADGSALAGTDFNFAAGTLWFSPGQSRLQAGVSLIPNTLDQDDRAFTLALASPTNVSLSRVAASATIVDDDPSPLISVRDASALEGSASSNQVRFDVSLSAPSGRTVQVNYSTADGTATASIDYLAAAGTLTFRQGEQVKPVFVSTIADAANEADETFELNMYSPVNSELSRASAIGTILNDDPAAMISISDASLTEGNTETNTAAFTATLSAPVGLPVTVNYRTDDATASAGLDYISDSGTLTFLPGEVSKKINISVTADTLNEADETFLVTLSNPTNATLAKAQGEGLIVNDDALPSLVINDISVTEGNAGTIDAVFMVSLSAASGREIMVNFGSANGTATAGSDFVSTSGSLTFSPGTVSRQVIVKIVGDTTGEFDEIFQVKLSGETNAAQGKATATGTILNDDPVVTIEDASIVEGSHLELGQTPSVSRDLTFTVRLSPAQSTEVRVAYMTFNGSATDGTNVTGSQNLAPDYVKSSGTITFAVGETSKQIAVTVISDQWNEADEFMIVALSTPVGATVLDSSAQGTILNDDVARFAGGTAGSTLEPHPPTGCQARFWYRDACWFDHGGNSDDFFSSATGSPHLSIIFVIGTSTQYGTSSSGSVVLTEFVEGYVESPSGLFGAMCQGERVCAAAWPVFDSAGSWRCGGYVRDEIRTGDPMDSADTGILGCVTI